MPVLDGQIKTRLVFLLYEYFTLLISGLQSAFPLITICEWILSLGDVTRPDMTYLNLLCSSKATDLLEHVSRTLEPLFRRASTTDLRLEYP